MADDLDLLLFTTDPDFARRALTAGITGFIVDWENTGKSWRQDGRDTEINRDTAENVDVLAGITGARVVCRINRFGDWTPREVDTAIAHGATHLLLPMVQTVQEVERFLVCTRDRAKAGILVETLAGCGCARELAAMPLDLVYVGLNDLAIQRGSSNIFKPFLDGTVDVLRECFRSVPFGIAGLTVIDRGYPVPCLYLMQELARLDVDFVFLRRSFKKDIPGRDMNHEISRIKAKWRELRAREGRMVLKDHELFVSRVESMTGSTALKPSRV